MTSNITIEQNKKCGNSAMLIVVSTYTVDEQCGAIQKNISVAARTTQDK